jgi:high-affinity nickel-transport protein
VLGKAHEHAHHHATDRQYGSGTAYGIGLIHGVGAETGTQVLIIGAAVGAGSKGMSVATLLVFVLGLLISNSIVTIASTTGFISAQRRQIVYVAVGVVAAVFSLVVGLVFLSQSGDVLPSLDPFVRWIGGPD